jgi:CBS domain-containing protein
MQSVRGGVIAMVTVQDFMSNRPIHIKEEDSISFVVGMFERTHISGAPVVNAQGEYVGVISKTDLVSTHLLKMAGELGNATAGMFMSRQKPLTIEKDESIEAAVDAMLEHHVHRLFVVDQAGGIVGVISSSDIMRAIKRPGRRKMPVLRAVLPFSAESGMETSSAETVPVPDPTAETNSTDKPKKTRADRERELEMRIFNLISRKQEEHGARQNSP